jgi:hypothetical protein
MTGGARGEGILEKEKRGRRGRLGHRGAHAGRGERGAARPKERRGGREKEKAFLFLISIFSYMPNSSIHSTNKRVHNPA